MPAETGTNRLRHLAELEGIQRTLELTHKHAPLHPTQITAIACSVGVVGILGRQRIEVLVSIQAGTQILSQRTCFSVGASLGGEEDVAGTTFLLTDLSPLALCVIPAHRVLVGNDTAGNGADGQLYILKVHCFGGHVAAAIRLVVFRDLLLCNRSGVHQIL